MPPRKAARYLQPGRRPERVAAVVLAETRRTGEGISYPEIAAAYERAYGEPLDPLLSVVPHLVKRGVLEVVGGYALHLRYGHVDHPVGAGPDDAFADRVVEAVHAVVAATGRPAPTAAVRRHLIERGVSFAGMPPLVRTLERLTEAKVRGPSVWRASRLRVITGRTRFKRSLYWAPLDFAWDQPVAPKSGSQATRQAVAFAAEDLGRHPERREIGWWVEAHAAGEAPAADAAPAVLERRLVAEALAGRRISDMLTRAWRNDHGGGSDLTSPKRPGELRLIETPLSCFGGPPPRYALDDETPEQHAANRLDDALMLYVPAREADGIRALELHAAGGSRTAAALAALRRRLLGAAIVRHVGDAARIPAAAERCDDAVALLATWAQHPGLTKSQQYGRSRMVADRRDHLAAVRAFAFDQAMSTRGDADGDAARLVGTDAKVAPRDARAYAERLVLPVLELPATRAELLFTEARRVPVPLGTPRQTKWGNAGAEYAPLAYVDRPDLVLELMRAVATARASTLITNASLYLGHVLRDADVVRALLADTPPREAVERRALVVALGMLGECAVLDVACPDPADPHDAAAYALGVTLADPDGALDRVREADRRAEGAATAVTDRAVARLEDGMLATVVG